MIGETEQDYINKGYKKVSESEYNKVKEEQIRKMREDGFKLSPGVSYADYDSGKINGEMMFFVKWQVK